METENRKRTGTDRRTDRRTDTWWQQVPR